MHSHPRLSLNRIFFSVLLLGAILLQACTRADAPPQTAPPVPTSAVVESQERSLENIIAFSRIMGYVRHFHPSDEAAAANWEDFAARGMLAVEDAKSAADLVGRLKSLFRHIAPTVQVFLIGEPPRSAPLSPPQDVEPLYVIAWKHVGFGGGLYQQIGYSSERVRTPMTQLSADPNLANPARPFAADLGGGVSALVPLALYADEQGTLPHATSLPKADSPTPQDDRAKRLAAVALAWNVFQHFYPYFDVVPVDWLAVLGETLAAARTDDDVSFLKTLRRMVAQLQDGHAAVGVGTTSPTAITMMTNPPWDWIENQLVLTLVRPSEQLQPGDVVLKVNGQRAEDLIAEEEQYISASTTQHRHAMAVRYLWAHQTGDPMTLEIQKRSGAVVSLTRSRYEICCIKPMRMPVIEEIRPGILYIDLSQFSTADFENAIPKMQQFARILFDARGGYLGKLNASTLGHLSDVPMKWGKFYWPIITYPDHQNMSFRVDEPTVGPQMPRLTAKVAFLTDVSALSYSESYLAFVEQYKLGEIVGEPTAGMTGGIDPFTLFNRYTFNWTGTKVLKQDGSRHHGVGILPTVHVSRTIQGIAEGKDEILERAMEVVSP